MLRCIWQQGASRCFPFKVEEAGDGADMALSVMLMLGGAELQDDEERLQQDQHEQADLSSGGSSASSVVGEGDAPGLEEQPVPPPGVVVDLAELLARQGLREQFEGERSKHPVIYDNVVNKCIGRMQTICGNPKAVCSLHGPGSACSFFVGERHQRVPTEQSIRGAVQVVGRWPQHDPSRASSACQGDEDSIGYEAEEVERAPLSHM